MCAMKLNHYPDRNRGNSTPMTPPRSARRHVCLPTSARFPSLRLRWSTGRPRVVGGHSPPHHHLAHHANLKPGGVTGSTYSTLDMRGTEIMILAAQLRDRTTRTVWSFPRVQMVEGTIANRDLVHRAFEVSVLPRGARRPTHTWVGRKFSNARCTKSRLAIVPSTSSSREAAAPVRVVRSRSCRGS